MIVAQRGVRRKEMFADRRTTLLPTRQTCSSSFLAELPRFENSRTVKMPSSGKFALGGTFTF
jgi:hypothetical protein